MPNWCYNAIEVYGGNDNGDERNRFFSAEEVETTSPLQKYLPMSEYHQTQKGYNDGGYEWCITTWGTKWPENQIDYQNNGDRLYYSFDSAWSPPIEGYEAISKMFPSLFFVHMWVESAMAFAGAAIYNNGSTIYFREVEGEDFPYAEDFDEYDEKMEDLMNTLLVDARTAMKEVHFIE